MVGVLHFMRSMAIAAAVLELYWFMWLATYELKGSRNLLASVSPVEVLRAEGDFGKWWRLVLLSLPLGVAMLLVSLNANSPRYLVEHYSGESALG
jgi:O-antigen/teichoic acid export membrane protein